MQQAFEFFFAAWPLLVVAALAFVMIRAARGPRRDRGDAPTDHEAVTWARSEARASRRDETDFGGGGGGAGGAD